MALIAISSSGVTMSQRPFPGSNSQVFCCNDYVSFPSSHQSSQRSSSSIAVSTHQNDGSSVEHRVVTLLDYGDGNVRSIRNAIQLLGYHIHDEEEEVFDKPGVHSTLARVIACLDVRSNDRGDLVVTKGDQYDVREQSDGREVRNLGKPVELASRYYQEGADEVAFLNITGFRDFPLGDMPMLEVLRQTSEKVFVPLTVGGGIRDFKDKNGVSYSSLEVAAEYFRSGADKISIGSDAVYAAEEFVNTGIKTGKSSLEQISHVYGNQAVVVSIDPRRVYVKNPNDVSFKTIELEKPGPNGEKYAWYQCTVSGGRENRQIGAYELAQAVEELGAGEILLNCIDCDGQGQGFDLDLVKLVCDAVSIPVIASSGAGAPEHFSQVFQKTSASAALAAGIFHRQEVNIAESKAFSVCQTEKHLRSTKCDGRHGVAESVQDSKSIKILKTDRGCFSLLKKECAPAQRMDSFWVFTPPAAS
ncbi:hypothetical protein GOP47_0020141 [Adiantum capillus-veneris]|uniref:Imidazole glycerol-phosphate synthase n=1 Tax=Adiantum capillus-veneris TaxID=13818 RepID=A0A9D4UDZ4_ADICA|nr:hypothetical protein GOP47_0020141 [Adiantum capillus-veneris]